MHSTRTPPRVHMSPRKTTRTLDGLQGVLVLRENIVCYYLLIKLNWLQEVSNPRTQGSHQRLNPLSNHTLPGIKQHINLSYSSSTSHVTRPSLINKLPHCPPSTRHHYILGPPPHHHHCLLLLRRASVTTVNPIATTATASNDDDTTLRRQRVLSSAVFFSFFFSYPFFIILQNNYDDDDSGGTPSIISRKRVVEVS